MQYDKQHEKWVDENCMSEKHRQDDITHELSKGLPHGAAKAACSDL